MTKFELLTVCFVCLGFGWSFLVFAHRPDIALYFMFAAGGGFLWDAIRDRRKGKQ